LRARRAAIIAGPRPPRDKRPSWLPPLLVRGLDPDPDRRWPTLQALLDAITMHRGRRRWPRPVVVGMGAIGLAAAIVVGAWPARSELAPRFHLEPLIQHGGLRSAAISPDASKVAIVAGDSLVIRSLDVGADDRVIIAHGIGDTVADVPAAWSPDGRQVLVAATPSIAGVFDTELVDIHDGARSRLPTRGVASFLSDTEIVTWTFRERSIRDLPRRRACRHRDM